MYTASVTLDPNIDPPFPDLNTARLSLLPLKETEAEDLFRLYSDPKVVQYSDAFLDSPEAALACIHRYGERYQRGEAVRWGIHLHSNGGLIGTVGFQSIFLSRAELAFELAEEHWNQGIMSEVLATVLPFGLQALGFHRIQAWTHVDNAASVHLLLKQGFVEEGRMAQACYLGYLGEWIDIRVFAMLA